MRKLIAVAATLLVIAIVEALRVLPVEVPSPAAPLFVALVFAALYGGWVAGTISAVATIGYYLWFYEWLEADPVGQDEHLRVLLLSLASFAIVGVVVLLDRRLAARERLRAREAEKALARSEGLYKVLFNGVRDPVLVYPVSADGIPQPIVAVNDAAVELYGYTRDQLATKTVAQIIHPSIDPISKLQHVLTRGDAVFQSVHVAADGRQIQVEVRSHRMELDGQTAVLSISRDVTERRQAEQALRRERDFTNTILETVGSVVVVLDRAGRIIRCNRTAQMVSGYPADELVQMNLMERLVPEDERETVERVFHELLASKSPNAYRNHWITRDGEPRLMEWSNTVVLDDAGEVEYVIGTAIDVTERVEAEQQLHRYHEHLEQRVTERTAELESANLALAAEVKEREAMEHRLREAHAQIVTAEQRERRRLAEVLHDHLQQLLVAAKLRIGMIRSVDQVRDQLGPILDEAITASRSLAVDLSPPVLQGGTLLAAMNWLAGDMQRQHGLSVDVDLAGEPVELPEQTRIFLFQSVRELLFNVVKHAQVGAAVVQLSFEPAELRVRVIDKGVGYDPSTSDRGSLGLFQVRDRLEMLGGRFEICSPPGEGVTVLLTLPISTPDPTDEAAPAPTEADDDPLAEPPQPGLRIVIADDHALFRAGLANLLRDQPGVHVVGEASDGDRAIHVAEQLRPDVVLMDINMPVLNGIEATRKLKKRQPGTRVIGLSMHNEPDVAQRMISAGADAYVCKDGPPEELLRVIRGSAAQAISAAGSGR